MVRVPSTCSLPWQHPPCAWLCLVPHPRVPYGAKHFPAPRHHSSGLLQQLAHHTRRAIAHHRCLQPPRSNQHHFADMSQHGTVHLWIRAYHHCRQLPTSTTSTCWNPASPSCSPAMLLCWWLSCTAEALPCAAVCISFRRRIAGPHVGQSAPHLAACQANPFCQRGLVLRPPRCWLNINLADYYDHMQHLKSQFWLNGVVKFSLSHMQH